MLARAGVGKGVPRAGLLLMVAANVPDLDIVSGLAGSLTYLEFHRWFTHSILAIPLMAVIAAGIAKLFSKGQKFPWMSALIAGSIGVATHLGLDWTNIYGIRLLLPFSPDWLRIDITQVIDLWIWAFFAIAVVAPALGKLVSSEIGAKSSTGRGWAIFALVMICGYEYARYLAHDRAVAILNSRVYDHAVPSRVAAMPTFANPLEWRGLVETPDAYRTLAVNLAGSFNPSAGQVFYKAQPNAATEAASQTATFQKFLSFSAYPLWRTIPVPEPDGGTEVQLFDVRFGDPQRPAFVCSAIVDRSNIVRSTSFQFGRPR